MTDLYLAVALLSAISFGLLALTIRVGRDLPQQTLRLLAMLMVMLLLVQMKFASDKMWVARVLPFANTMILGNLLLPIAAMLGGFGGRIIPGRLVRKMLLLVPLAILCAHLTFYPVYAGAPTPLADRWRDGVCMQTSRATCSPAAAATLLNTQGIETTESEMADLCRTTTRGSLNQGIFRALKLKTAGTAWDVEAFHTDFEGLRQMNSPMILAVGLEAGRKTDPRYEQLWGWIPGVAHTVVCFDISADGEHLNIGDPSIGREQWTPRDIRILWHGEGMRLVPRT